MLTMTMVVALTLMAADVVREVEVISDAQMWSLIVGFLSPLVIAVIQQPKWSGPIRVLVAVLWSALAGGMTSWLAGDFGGRSALSCALIVCVTAIATYQQIWRPTRIAPTIEAKTSPPSEVHVIHGPGDTEEVVVDDPRTNP